MNKPKDSRQRNFATIVYPDSAPEGWLTFLRELKSPVFVSPLHDRDIDPDGQPKKPHYHVMFMFEGKKSDEQIAELRAAIGGVGDQRVNSKRGYARYLCHLDNPEKHQYPVDSVMMFGGADYTDVIGLPIDRYKAVGEMIEFCDERNINSYSVLLRYARVFRFDWFRVLVDSSTLVMKEFLKSRSWTSGNLTPEECEILDELNGMV